MDNTSALLPASTAKAATNVNDMTLDSAFNLLVNSGLKLCSYRRLSGKTLQIPTFESFIIWFGVLHLLVFFLDFFELLTFNQKSEIMKPRKESYRSFNGW